jgi:hypothetical protein
MTDQPELRLIEVPHIRCGEQSAVTIVMCPIDWTPRQIRDGIERARTNYLEGLRIARENDPAPPSPYITLSFYDKYPDKTVREIQAMIEERKVEHRAWKERNDKATSTFTKFLIDEGFIALWQTELPRFEVDWGHRHGQNLAYDNDYDRLDTLPKPIKIADPNFDEDDW